MTRAYNRLVQRLVEIHDLGTVAGVLQWDQEVMMPPKGVDARARQTALLARLAHERLTDPETADLINGADTDTDIERAMVREARRERDRAVKVPGALVEEIVSAAMVANAAWVEARKRNDYPAFAPHLQRLLHLKRREAEALGHAAGGTAYDALLDLYEPGATVAVLNPIIERTRAITMRALDAIKGSSVRPDRSILKREFPEAAQEAFSKRVLADVGFAGDGGRLDRSPHPFSTSFDAGDLRITTRYETHWLPSSLFGTLHEVGHAFYEGGRPADHWHTPLGESVSLGIHESQSRFWENQIGRSRAFWSRWFGPLVETFPAALGDVSIEDFFAAINSVEPSLIRVEADEVTYNLHIVIRYEIEQALFAGDVTVADLPALWNDKYAAYLGVRPPDDAAGVMQDVHWSHGGFGYFPTYLLGNLYAAQWTAQLKKELPDFDALVERGGFATILNRLRTAIHNHGRLYSPAELAVRFSGEPLNPDHFERHLKERFGAVYGVAW